MRYRSLPVCSHPLVSLRPLAPDDLAPWSSYLSLPQVREHTSWADTSVEALADLLEAYSRTGPADPMRLAIVSRLDERLVGTIGFHTVSSDGNSAELAYDLLPAMWGRGIASHVAGIMVEWGHSGVGLNRIQAAVLDTNQRSVRVLQRTGFFCEGLLHSYRLVRGAPRDFFLYANIRAGHLTSVGADREG
jgi:ribosomal-protein-alanine N-acetyltransferase